MTSEIKIFTEIIDNSKQVHFNAVLSDFRNVIFQYSSDGFMHYIFGISPAA